MSSDYYVVKFLTNSVHRNGSECALFSHLEEMAYAKFECAGIEEYSFDEEEVDEILGVRAIQSFVPSNDLYDEIEKKIQKKHNRPYFFFFDGDRAETCAQAFLNEAKKVFPQVDISLLCLPCEDWNQKWKSFYHEVEISDSLLICPAYFSFDKERRKILEEKYSRREIVYINPGQGFGTGTHETTFLCLRALTELHSHFKTCLDFGCGSGVLGISAIKLFGMKVDFCDIDTNALDNTKENILLNFSETDSLDVSLISRDRLCLHPQNETYDLIFANILYPVLFEEKNLLLSLLKKEGFLMLSGILKEQIESLKEEYLTKHSDDFELVCLKEEVKNDWALLLFKKQ